MAFYVGQKVVCVDHEWSPRYALPGVMLRQHMDGLSKGAVYTVRSVKTSAWTKNLLLFLNELERPACPLEKGEAGYDARRFRPITERKTDISIFKAMLNPSKTEVTA